MNVHDSVTEVSPISVLLTRPDLVLVSFGVSRENANVGGHYFGMTGSISGNSLMYLKQNNPFVWTVPLLACRFVGELVSIFLGICTSDLKLRRSILLLILISHIFAII